MNKYKLYCTEEQTGKAFELGAPIEEFCGLLPTTFIDGIIYDIPTTEEMLGWLEDGVFREVNVQEFANYWEYNLYTSSDDVVSHKGHFHSRKEATIAAIDAALEYLSNQKTNNNED